MSQFDINNNAKQELEAIINDLFFDKIDSKLNEKVQTISNRIDEKSRGINSKIEGVSTSFQKSMENVEEFMCESKNRDGELLKKVEENSESFKAIDLHIIKNNEEVASIQNKLSQIQDENLAEILTSAIRIINDQKLNSESLLLKLDDIVFTQGENIDKITFDNVGNRKIFENIITELEFNIVGFINENEKNQNNNLHILDKSISNFLNLEKENNENLIEKLDSKFNTIEELKLYVMEDIDNKIEILKNDNEKTLKLVLWKSNTLFISVLIINLFIIVLMVLYYLTLS
jgi:hypothetical protein